MDWLPGSLGPDAKRCVEKIRQHIDKVFETFGREAPDVFGGGVYPLVNVYETESEVVVRCELPGAAKETLDVSLTGLSLTISGEERAEAELEGMKCLRQERGHGRFSRTIQLPNTVDPEADPAARLRDGVLEVRVPKRKPEASRKITVQD